MSDFTFSEKAWDKVRPSSVKKTGLSEAMNAFLKTVPGGNTDGLKTTEACVKAIAAIGPLQLAMTKAVGMVSSAKDDTKGGAEALKKWNKEVKDGVAALDARKLELSSAIFDSFKSAVEKWKPVKLRLEDSVQDILDGFNKCEQNQGQAEGIAEEAVMTMVQQAGQLRETGHTGDKPADFVDD